MRDFPILHDTEIKSIPWAVMAPHEQRALTNHRQTLEQLANRGGVTPEEALAIIEDRMWIRMPFREAREKLLEYCRTPPQNHGPFTAYDNNVGDGWQQFTISGAGAENLSTADVEKALNGGAALQEAIDLITRLRNVGDIHAATRHHFNKLLVLLERAK